MAKPLLPPYSPILKEGGHFLLKECQNWGQEKPVKQILPHSYFSSYFSLMNCPSPSRLIFIIYYILSNWTCNYEIQTASLCLHFPMTSLLCQIKLMLDKFVWEMVLWPRRLSLHLQCSKHPIWEYLFGSWLLCFQSNSMLMSVGMQ